MRSLLEGDGCKNGELNEKAGKVKNYEEAIRIAKEYETIIKTQKKKYTKCRV